MLRKLDCADIIRTYGHNRVEFDALGYRGIGLDDLVHIVSVRSLLPLKGTLTKSLTRLNMKKPPSSATISSMVENVQTPISQRFNLPSRWLNTSEAHTDLYRSTRGFTLEPIPTKICSACSQADFVEDSPESSLVDTDSRTMSSNKYTKAHTSFMVMVSYVLQAAKRENAVAKIGRWVTTSW